MRPASEADIAVSRRRPGDFRSMAPRQRRCLNIRQYARLPAEWIARIGLDPSLSGTPSLRRTKGTLISRRTGNLRAVQLPLGTQVEKLDTCESHLHRSCEKPVLFHSS